MFVPTLFWLTASWIPDVTHSAAFQGIYWTTGSSVLFGVLIVALPFIWKGSPSGGKILKGLFQPVDLLSILLALLPVAIWIGALYSKSQDLTSSFNSAFHLQLPFKGLLTSPFWLLIVTSSIVSVVASVFSMLAICSATIPRDRFLFLAILGFLGVVTALAQYGVALSQGLPRQVPASLYSPMSALIQQLGVLAVIGALLQRERHLLQSVAIFLISEWMLLVMPNSRDNIATAIGLFGGAVVIFVVNFLQRTGRWVRWSAESDSHTLV